MSSIVQERKLADRGKSCVPCEVERKWGNCGQGQSLVPNGPTQYKDPGLHKAT